MAHSELLTIDRPHAWDKAVAHCGRHDSYHLAGYHALAKSQNEGEPYLLSFEAAGHAAALPFVVRPIAGVPGLDDCPLNDAVSVYGYPGVLATIARDDAEAEQFRVRFQQTLAEALESLGVVCLFVRQNPLLDTTWLLSPLAETAQVGPTVAVDLTLPEEQQWQNIRKDHRYDIRRGRQHGVVVREDPLLSELDLFRHIYTQTMAHLEADEYYYFDEAYFHGLKHNLPGRVKLLFAQLDDRPIAAAMFLLCGDIIQYHLSGTLPEFLKFRGGMKNILDDIRAWGTHHGFSWLHLGGGLGARRDRLFEFKAGFSSTHRWFETARLVVKPGFYRQLMVRRQRWLASEGYETEMGEYFPAYRQIPRRRAA